MSDQPIFGCRGCATTAGRSGCLEHRTTQVIPYARVVDPECPECTRLRAQLASEQFVQVAMQTAIDNLRKELAEAQREARILQSLCTGYLTEVRTLEREVKHFKLGVQVVADKYDVKKARCTRLEQTLRFYANPNSYLSKPLLAGTSKEILWDEGAKARAALAEGQP